MIVEHRGDCVILTLYARIVFQGCRGNKLKRLRISSIKAQIYCLINLYYHYQLADLFYLTINLLIEPYQVDILDPNEA